MQALEIWVACSCLVAGIALGSACRGQLPPTEPRRVVEESPGSRTDDGLGAAPVAGLRAPSVTAALGGSGDGTPPPLPLGGGGARPVQ